MTGFGLGVGWRVILWERGLFSPFNGSVLFRTSVLCQVSLFFLERVWLQWRYLHVRIDGVFTGAMALLLSSSLNYFFAI